MELQSANKHSKIYEPDASKYMVNLQASLKCYGRACDFVKEYMKHKELSAPEQLSTEEFAQYSICTEMLELLPVKLDKINA